METASRLRGLLKTALANGAVGFTLRTGLHPVIYSSKGVKVYDSEPATGEDIGEIIRLVVNSREMRQFRAAGKVHFKCVLDDVPLFGGLRAEGEDLRVELRKLAQCPRQ